MVHDTPGATAPDSANAGGGEHPIEKAREGKRARAAVLVAAGAAAGIVGVFSHHYPLYEWLLWAVVRYWFNAAYWATGCLGFGLWLLSLVCRSAFRFTERLVVGFALGVLGFAVVTFVAGIAGLLNYPF